MNYFDEGNDFEVGRIAELTKRLVRKKFEQLKKEARANLEQASNLEAKQADRDKAYNKVEEVKAVIAGKVADLNSEATAMLKDLPVEIRLKPQRSRMVYPPKRDDRPADLVRVAPIVFVEPELTAGFDGTPWDEAVEAAVEFIGNTADEGVLAVLQQQKPKPFPSPDEIVEMFKPKET